MSPTAQGPDPGGYRPTSRGATVARPPPAPPHVPAIRGIPGPFRLYFVSFDYNEPPPAHVQQDRATAKFWLDPLTLAANHGLSPRDLSLARRVIFERRPRIVEAWREHCGATGE